MHCEFCDKRLYDLASARRHILSISHIRSKRQHELSTAKLTERLRQKIIHPVDFYDLLKLINVYSARDVTALNDLDFFEIESKIHNRIVHELIKILYLSVNDFHLQNLPPEMKQAFLDSYRKNFE